MEDAPDHSPSIPVLDEIIRRLVKTFNPHRIVLFGSWARGEAGPDSDLDLLVVADSEDPVHLRMARAQRALRGLATPVDVFVSTPEEVRRFRTWLSHTVAVALREGKVVYAAR